VGGEGDGKGKSTKSRRNEPGLLEFKPGSGRKKDCQRLHGPMRTCVGSALAPPASQDGEEGIGKKIGEMSALQNVFPMLRSGGRSHKSATQMAIVGETKKGRKEEGWSNVNSQSASVFLIFEDDSCKVN